MFSASDAGQEQEAYAYDAFGAQPNAPFGSLSLGYGQYQEYGAGAGYQTDPETGLIRCGNRYYDPGIGRFITNDPAQSGTNWYAYCGNNPTDKIDPTGLHWVVKNGKNVWVPDPNQPSDEDPNGGWATGFNEGDKYYSDGGGTETLTNGAWVPDNTTSSPYGAADPMGYLQGPAGIGGSPASKLTGKVAGALAGGVTAMWVSLGITLVINVLTDGTTVAADPWIAAGIQAAIGAASGAAGGAVDAATTGGNVGDDALGGAIMGGIGGAWAGGASSGGPLGGPVTQWFTQALKEYPISK